MPYFRHSPSPLKRQARGFTMIELMVVIGLIAILTMLAVPSYQRLMASTAVNSVMADLSTDLQFARSEALKRGMSVAVCSSSSADNYDSCTDDGEWGNGWIVFVDRNANNLRSTTTADDEILLRVRQLMDDPVRTRVIGPPAPATPASSSVKVVRFDRSGTASAATLVASPKQGNAAIVTAVQRAACVSTTGRVRLTDSGTATCN